ncbi:MAG: bifunctional riboflavin kinase/FAD synthetase [Methylophilaceae bacterium]|nr:bifunctional riboflavin kinase/FAD synthetase [Methylophilaceae bacterium]
MQIFRHLPTHPEGPSALAIGNFDGVHLGHQAILRRLGAVAAARDLTMCVLTFEPHPREFFAPDQAPARLTSMREKLELFAELNVQRTYVCRFDTTFATMEAPAFIANVLRGALDVRVLLVGEDFRFGARRRGSVADLRNAGIEVEILPDVRVDGVRVSSTAVREALATGDMAGAKKLLGRVYSISGHVVHGDKQGRVLGYPTANVEMHHDKPPLTGVYAVKLSGLEEGEQCGVASLGIRPTLKRDGKPTLEVHLFDFERDIYGQHVRVHFLKKIRAEQKFPNLEALKRQIDLDVRVAREYFATEVR